LLNSRGFKEKKIKIVDPIEHGLELNLSKEEREALE
jgi:hypothetical protein